MPAYIRPVFEETLFNGKKAYRIKTRNKKEAKKILTGLKNKKHPNLNVEEILNMMVFEEQISDDIIQIPLHFGGEKIGRSLVKSVLGWAVENQIPASLCPDAIAYLSNSDSPPPVSAIITRTI